VFGCREWGQIEPKRHDTGVIQKLRWHAGVSFQGAYVLIMHRLKKKYIYLVVILSICIFFFVEIMTLGLVTLGTLESGINIPLRLLIFGIFSRGYSFITDLKDLDFNT
jgi:hypothetical protein